MNKPEIHTHHNKMDIIQRLMAETMKGYEPLKGALKYEFPPIFLNEINGVEDEYVRIIDKIRGNPSTVLSEEEKMFLVYRPLFNFNEKEIEREAYHVIKDIQELEDEPLRAKLSGTIYVLVQKYLSEEGNQKIWEVLMNMSIVEKEMKKNLMKEFKV